MGNDELLQLTTDDEGVITLDGDIDLASGPMLEAVVWRRRAEDGLVLDLSGVTFIDSSGLRTLLRIAKRADESGTTLVLRRVHDTVERLFDITATRECFTIEGSDV